MTGVGWVGLAIGLIWMFDSLVAAPVAGICEGLVAVVAPVHAGLGVGPDVADKVAAAGALLPTQQAA